MKIDISAQKMELTPALKKYIDRKFARLEKFNKDFQLQVHLSSIKHKAVVHLILSGGKEIHQLLPKTDTITSIRLSIKLTIKSKNLSVEAVKG